jgi:hypothetical protein
MITKQQIERAMDALKDKLTREERGIYYSLKVYQQRGEYDGTYTSAVECLRTACYEVEGYD